MPHTPLRELRPELFENKYETDSGGIDFESESDDLSQYWEEEDEFNLDGLDIDDDVQLRV